MMIHEIIKYFGSQALLADRLNIDRAAVNRWVKEEHIPPLRAIQIELISKGRFKAIDIIKEGELND